MEPIRKQNVLISTLSTTGFVSVIVGFVLAIAFAILMTTSMPASNTSVKLNTALSRAALTDDNLNASPFTIRLANISIVQQKVYLYAVYIVKEHHPRFLVNATLSRAKSPTDLTDLTLIKTTSKRQKTICSGTTCTTLLTSFYPTAKNETYQGTFSLIPKNPTNDASGLTVFLVYTNIDYTIFESFWRIFFLLFMMIVVSIFFFVLRTYPITEWTIEQKWTAALVLTILLANNPFFPFSIRFGYSIFLYINTIADTIMIGFVLLYILIIFDALRKPLSQRTVKAFYFPRFVLIALMGSFIVNLYIYNVDNSQPTMLAFQDTFNAVLAVCAFLTVIVYVFWFVFAVIRSISEARKLGEIGSRIRMFGFFTVVNISIFIVLLVTNFFGGYQSNDAVYLMIIACINIYTLAMMVFYLPTQRKSQEWSRRRKEIILDDVKVTGYDEEDNALVLEESDSQEHAAVQESAGVLLDKNEIDLN